jgi:carboxyl-terminal processing protease
MFSLVGIALVAACGGGGGSPGVAAPSARPPPAPPPAVFTPAPTPPAGPVSFAAASTLAQQCSASNAFAPSAARTGTLAREKEWIRSYFDENYLWFDEVPSVDANNALFTGNDHYTAVDSYFEALKTTATTASGARRDKFSFIYPTAEWDALFSSGVSAGYGIEWTIGSSTPPRNIRVAYVQPNSPASTAGLLRGDTLVSVDGASADINTQAGVGTLNEGLFPSALGTPHAFVFSRVGAANVNVSLTSASVTQTPVLLTKVLTAADGKKVGYIVFNDHIAPSEPQLITAFNTLKTAGVEDLVLDLRYNGGGYLYIASQVAYMIAGEARTKDKIFEKSTFNSKRVADNAAAAQDAGFITESCVPNAAFTACTKVEPLPVLNLPRVFVLARSGTCSASEAIINGLRGVDVDVKLIGSTTCGKPYGFTQKDNCGISYFPIEFKGANNKGFGDYSDGFAANCAASDDLSKPLGDPSEGMLATALAVRTLGSCSTTAAAKSKISDGFMIRSPARENRIRLKIK